MPGYAPVSGSASARCRGASWDNPPLICQPICPTLPMPANAASCSQTLFAENFANATTAATRFASIDPNRQPFGTTWTIMDGVLQVTFVSLPY
jgi:hypothetical protein